MFYNQQGEEIDRDTWSKLFDDHEWRQIWIYRWDGYTVSTVWLWLDHGFRKGKPLIFETMIFGGDRDGETYRYSNLEEARKWHKKIINACNI